MTNREGQTMSDREQADAETLANRFANALYEIGLRLDDVDAPVAGLHVLDMKRFVSEALKGVTFVDSKAAIRESELTTCPALDTPHLCCNGPRDCVGTERGCEHCAPHRESEPTCPTCDGAGEVESRIVERTPDGPVFHTGPCITCGGTGERPTDQQIIDAFAERYQLDAFVDSHAEVCPLAEWDDENEVWNFTSPSESEPTRAELVEALREIWLSVPGTYDADDPMDKRHVAALIAARNILARIDATRQQQEGA